MHQCEYFNAPLLHLLLFDLDCILEHDIDIDLDLDLDVYWFLCTGIIKSS